jgi:hypothetical protein
MAVPDAEVVCVLMPTNVLDAVDTLADVVMAVIAIG